MKALILEKQKEYPKFSNSFELLKEDNMEQIDVSFAAINHRDLWIAKGFYPGIKENRILGSDCSGIWNNEEVILNSGLNWGDNQNFQSNKFEVLGMPRNGTFAEQVNLDSKYIYKKPNHLTMLEASALPLAGVTAYRAFIVKARPQKSDKVFISGIGGGVSLFAFQYAVALGCEVYVSSSSKEKIKKAIEMGAAGGVLYSDQEFAKELLRISGGIDVIIDSAGGDGFSSLVFACNPGARMVFYGGTRGKINNLNPQIIFWRQIEILGTTMGSDLDFKNMLQFVDDHKIVPIVDKVYALSDINKAFDRMSDGKQFGKIVFDISL